MNTEQQQAAGLIQKLWSNPAIREYTPLQKEEQIIQFLHVNAGHLGPTLSSSQFFPEKSWNQIFDLLIEALQRQTDSELQPSLERIVQDQIRFSFISFLQERASPTVKNDILPFLLEILKKSEARKLYTGAHTALVHRFADRYIEDIFERKSYIHFELTKVQRLRMSKEEIKGMVEATLLLRPITFYLTGGDTESKQRNTTGTVASHFAENTLGIVKKQLKNLPELLLKSAVYASVSFDEDRHIDATSRLSAVFSARCRNYVPGLKVDRGADTPDKSWFSIARKNHRYYGFDLKLLDELYRIAAENGW